MLVKEFSKRTESSGNVVSEFLLSSMNIYGLKDCFGGHSNRECPCVQKDDMDKIYPTVQSCGGIVLVSPLYYRNLSVQLRIAMDFLFAPEKMMAIRLINQVESYRIDSNTLLAYVYDTRGIRIGKETVSY